MQVSSVLQRTGVSIPHRYDSHSDGQEDKSMEVGFQSLTGTIHTGFDLKLQNSVV